MYVNILPAIGNVQVFDPDHSLILLIPNQSLSDLAPIVF